jgi:hypothetical protein
MKKEKEVVPKVGLISWGWVPNPPAKPELTGNSHRSVDEVIGDCFCISKAVGNQRTKVS